MARSNNMPISSTSPRRNAQASTLTGFAGLSPAPMPGAGLRTPRYIDEIDQPRASENDAASPPSPPVPIYRKRRASSPPDDRKGKQRRITQHNYFREVPQQPRGVPDEPYIGARGEWIHPTDATKDLSHMPTPVPTVYYPVGIENYTQGGPANTIGAPLRLGDMNNVYAPPPGVATEYTDRALAHMSNEAAKDPQWVEKMMGFDPGLMYEYHELDEPPTTSAQMALAAKKWRSLDDNHPLKVAKRPLNLDSILPAYRQKPSMHKEFRRLMDGLDVLKKEYFPGDVGKISDLGDPEARRRKMSAADRDKEKEYDEMAAKQLDEGVEAFRKMVKTLTPGKTDKDVELIVPKGLKLSEKAQYQMDSKRELARLESIQRETRAILHLHDIVWKDKLGDDPDVRMNKSKIRRQLRAQHENSYTRHIIQKSLTLRYLKRKEGEGLPDHSPDIHRNDEPVAMSKWRLPAAGQASLVPKRSKGQVTGKAMAAAPYFMASPSLSDSEIADTFPRSQSESSTVYPETKPVKWIALTTAAEVIEEAGITSGVIADSDALQSLNYVNPDSNPQTARAYVAKARAFEDFFLIMECVAQRAKDQEEIARKDLDKPYEPDLTPSLVDHGDEIVPDAPPFDTQTRNPGRTSYTATSSLPYTRRRSTGTTSDSRTEGLDDSDESEETSGSELDGDSAPDPKNVHFTPPAPNQTNPVKPHSATDREHHRTRAATPSKSVLKFPRATPSGPKATPSPGLSPATPTSHGRGRGPGVKQAPASAPRNAVESTPLGRGRGPGAVAKTEPPFRTSGHPFKRGRIEVSKLDLLDTKPATRRARGMATMVVAVRDGNSTEEEEVVKEEETSSEEIVNYQEKEGEGGEGETSSTESRGNSHGSREGDYDDDDDSDDGSSVQRDRDGHEDVDEDKSEDGDEE